MHHDENKTKQYNDDWKEAQTNTNLVWLNSPNKFCCWEVEVEIAWDDCMKTV